MSNQSGVYRLGKGYTAPFTAAAVRYGPLNAYTTTFRIASGAQALHFAVGDSTVVATATDPLLPANWIDYVNVAGGQYISVIADSAAGTAQITECTE